MRGCRGTGSAAELAMGCDRRGGELAVVVAATSALGPADSQVLVLIDGRPCEIRSRRGSEITCVLPRGSGTAFVQLFVNGVASEPRPLLAYEPCRPGERLVDDVSAIMLQDAPR